MLATCFLIAASLVVVLFAVPAVTSSAKDQGFIKLCSNLDC